MKHARGTIVLLLTLLAGFAWELITDSTGNDVALLRLGALPDSGQLDGQFWRLATYSFLHFNSAHLLINALLLLWVGRFVERGIGTPRFGAIYSFSVLTSAALILLFHYWHPKTGATVGASGGIFGLLGAALLIAYRLRSDRVRKWLWLALIIGFAVSFLPNISLSGHLGGLIGGISLAFVLMRPKSSES